MVSELLVIFCQPDHYGLNHFLTFFFQIENRQMKNGQIFVQILLYYFQFEKKK